MIDPREPWYVMEEQEREAEVAEVRRRADHIVRASYTLTGMSAQQIEDLTQIHMQIEREAMADERWQDEIDAEMELLEREEEMFHEG